MLNRNIFNQGEQDYCSWKFNSNKQYSAKSGYSQLMLQLNNGMLPNPEWPKVVWNRWVPFKICAFIWKAVQNRLPVYSNLRARGLWHEDISMRCKMCDSDNDETMVHLFFQCQLVVQVWRGVCAWLNINDFSWDDDAGDFPRLAMWFSNQLKNFGECCWQGCCGFFGKHEPTTSLEGKLKCDRKLWSK